jgi:hypothetical protein
MADRIDRIDGTISDGAPGGRQRGGWNRRALAGAAAMLVSLLVLVDCRMGQDQSAGSAGSAAPGSGAEAEHIQVQHVLVGFTGSIPGKRITRSQEEARVLAYDILKRAQGGADFNALVRDYTDDSPPGIYGMANRGVQPAQGEFPRDGMVPAFGNVGFALKVGGYGVADFDPRTSPYGYHVIKRLK